MGAGLHSSPPTRCALPYTHFGLTWGPLLHDGQRRLPSPAGYFLSSAKGHLAFLNIEPAEASPGLLLMHSSPLAAGRALPCGGRYRSVNLFQGLL